MNAALRRFTVVGGAGIRSLGWNDERTREGALGDSMAAMLVDARAGRFGT